MRQCLQGMHEGRRGRRRRLRRHLTWPIVVSLNVTDMDIRRRLSILAIHPAINSFRLVIRYQHVLLDYYRELVKSRQPWT